MREIELTGEPSVYVYDTSGPYTDPEVTIDLKKGLEPLRRGWIIGRGDVRGDKALRAKPGRNVSQMHYAKKGVITHEMEYIAIREDLLLEKRREAAQQAHPGQNFGAAIPERVTPEFVRANRATSVRSSCW